MDNKYLANKIIERLAFAGYNMKKESWRQVKEILDAELKAIQVEAKVVQKIAEETEEEKARNKRNFPQGYTRWICRKCGVTNVSDWLICYCGEPIPYRNE